MDIKTNVKSIDLLGKGESQLLKIVFTYDSTSKRESILNKLSGKSIKILTEKETLPVWIDAEGFNNKYPVGTPVKYYPIKGKKRFIKSKTRTPAWELGHGTPVVSIEGVSGGVALSHIELAPHQE